MRSLYPLLGFPAPAHTWDPTHRYQTSWLLSPAVLAACRLTYALYCWVSIIYTFVWNGEHVQALSGTSRVSFAYFTNLTYWGIACYTVVAGVHGIVYARTGRTWLDNWPRPLQALHGLLYSSVITYPIIVTLVYWIILFGGFASEYAVWANITRHALNSLLAMFEIIMPSTLPMPWLHLPILIIILALYLALAYLNHAINHFYVYPFLNPANGSKTMATGICGVLAAMIIVFLIVRGLVWVRGWATKRGQKVSRFEAGRFREESAVVAEEKDSV